MTNAQLWDLLKGENAEGRYVRNENGVRVKNTVAGLTYKNATAAWLAREGARAAAAGVPRAERGAVARSAYDRALKQLQEEGKIAADCVLPTAEEKEELSKLAEAMADLEGAAAVGGARRGRKRGTRRVQSGGSIFTNMYKLLAAWCGYGGAVATRMQLDAEVELLNRQLRVRARQADRTAIEQDAKRASTTIVNIVKGVGVGGVMTNLSRGPSGSWIYWAAASIGNILSSLAPSVSGLPAAVGTAGAATVAVVVPAATVGAAGAFTLMAWRAIKYGVGGVAAGGMGVASALGNLFNKIRPDDYEYPGKNLSTSLAHEKIKATLQARSLLLKYLSAILTGNPERLHEIMEEQGTADRLRASLQLGEVADRVGDVNAKGPTASQKKRSEESYSAKVKAAAAAAAAAKANAARFAAFTGKSKVPVAETAKVMKHAGEPAVAINTGAAGSMGALGALSRPPMSGPLSREQLGAMSAAAAPGIYGWDLEIDAIANAIVKVAEEAADMEMAAPGSLLGKRKGRRESRAEAAARGNARLGAPAAPAAAAAAANNFVELPDGSEGLAGNAAAAGANGAANGTAGGRRRKNRKSTRKNRKAKSKRAARSSRKTCRRS